MYNLPEFCNLDDFFVKISIVKISMYIALDLIQHIISVTVGLLMVFMQYTDDDLPCLPWL